MFWGLFILLPWFPVHAEEYRGIIVGVIDGDTVTLLDTANRQLRVRLAEIDTPESAQPYGHHAKQELSQLVHGKKVTVTGRGKDRYGRVIGRLYVEGVDVNAEMVRRGAAWVYRQYASDPALYGLEEQARRDKAGLWGVPEAERLPPWEWRRAKQHKVTGGDTVSEEIPDMGGALCQWWKRVLAMP